MTSENASYLPPGLPTAVAEPDGVSAPYWSGLREGVLRVQRCRHCRTWQFGPEWICHSCLQFDPAWVDVEPTGRIYSWERVWHPVHPALKGHGPYIAVLVELEHAGNVRMVGNLLGDPMQDVRIGAQVQGVFEHHPQSPHPHSLLQWRYR
ncbi:putative nucleic-acid-binding protein containing a Zn-ribbon [Variovorax sp. SRS16]|uniref:Zn-ribbon domain-containing OB-fold protein n=1 Tax=Variovorax sp. SRS16 TaxID=282217 RepID=UPI0013162E50|nr:OB-fold domain-containing protein [Variovorax sp. SRS16]VTU20600.1 putative nucleic-acid-binding protein containing a Zn-ribbon [Variovorax sp. SRS16]